MLAFRVALSKFLMIHGLNRSMLYNASTYDFVQYLINLCSPQTHLCTLQTPRIPRRIKRGGNFYRYGTNFTLDKCGLIQSLHSSGSEVLANMQPQIYRQMQMRGKQNQPPTHYQVHDPMHGQRHPFPAPCSLLTKHNFPQYFASPAYGDV